MKMTKKYLIFKHYCVLRSASLIAGQKLKTFYLDSFSLVLFFYRKPRVKVDWDFAFAPKKTVNSNSISTCCFWLGNIYTPMHTQTV